MYEQNVLYFVGESKDTFFNALYTGEEKNLLFKNWIPHRISEQNKNIVRSHKRLVGQVFPNSQVLSRSWTIDVDCDTNYYGKTTGLVRSQQLQTI